MKLTKHIIDILVEKNWTISIAESCTGGLLAHTITNTPGSSNYFTHGFITYSDEAKIIELNVSKEVIEKVSSYSADVAKMMAEGVRKIAKSTFGLAITGIAPPGDPNSSLKVGTAFFGISTNRETISFDISTSTKSREDFKNKLVKNTIDIFEGILKRYASSFTYL
jgi:PncC family amidohydrolase